MTNKSIVLNTRPEFSSQSTAQVFEDNGYSVINLPCIEITIIKNPENTAQKLAQISHNDTIIFTSQHAVSFAYQVYPELKPSQYNTIICIGTKTSQRLEQYTNAYIWTPRVQNSQGVIELLQNLKNLKKITLITAANGREEIQNFAACKAITLEQINVYQRRLPRVDRQILKQIEQAKPLTIIATSITTIVNLKQLVTDATWQHLKNQKIACASDRIAQEAKKLGFKNIINTQSANPKSIVKHLD